MLSEKMFCMAKTNLESFRDTISTYSLERLYDLGVEKLESDDLPKACISFEILSKHSDKKEYGELMVSLLKADMSLALTKKDEFDKYNSASSTVFSSMIDSTSLYADSAISLDELLLAERLVDDVAKKLVHVPIKGRDEYQQMYFKFKEYVMDKFISDR